MAVNTRGASWSDEEVLTLIGIWGDAKVQQELDGAVRNKTVFVKISRKMLEAGFTRNWKQCRDKLKNWKVGYKAAKDHNGRSGKGRKTCRYFKQLDEILGTRAATTPPQILESSGTETRPAEEESCGEQLDSESQPLGDVDGDGASRELLEIPVPTPSSTLTSQNTEESGEVGSKRELDSKQELPEKRSKVV